MISFRYHIVTLVSVFLALAVGVALGGGPLKGEVDNTLVEQVKNDREIKAELQTEIAGLRSGNDFTDEFAATVAPGLLGNSLQGRSVTLMVLPSAQVSDVTAITELVEVAGGDVAGTLRVGQDLLNAGKRGLVDELGTQLLDRATGLDVADDASPYERMGALVARAATTEQDRGAAVDEVAEGIISGLSTAGLMSPEADLEERGSLVVVVSGAGTRASSQEAQGRNTIVVALARAVDADTDGVVVAGPVASARADGLVASLRQDVAAAREVSTVDALDHTAGQVVAVLALAGEVRGETGHYGSVDATDGALPGAVPTD